MGKIVEKNRITNIYILIDPLTEEVRYVGKTVKTLKERLSGHLYSIKREDNHKTNWISSLLKKGEIPIIQFLDSCEWQYSQELEKHWISFYKKQGCKLVNTTEGGEGNLGGKRSSKAIKKLKNTLKEKAKSVYQYSLDGKFLQEYQSATEAAEKINGRYHNIYQCCNFSKKSHKGFIWSFLPPEKINLSKYKHSKTVNKVTENNNFMKKQKKIVVIDITNNTEIVCASIREASEVTGIGKPGICRECQGKAKTRGNFKFKYYE